MMSDEELTELECAIDDACRERIKAGFELAPGVCFYAEKKLCCPAGAVAGSYKFGDAEDAIGLPRGWFWSFGAGFDGYKPHAYEVNHYPYAHAMGARFRARWLAGEYK